MQAAAVNKSSQDSTVCYLWFRGQCLMFIMLIAFKVSSSSSYTVGTGPCKATLCRSCCRRGEGFIAITFDCYYPLSLGNKQHTLVLHCTRRGWSTCTCLKDVFWKGRKYKLSRLSLNAKRIWLNNKRNFNAGSGNTIVKSIKWDFYGDWSVYNHLFGFVT